MARNKQLGTNGNKTTNINEITNTLTKTISNQSASSNYIKIFQEQKDRIERKPRKCNSYNSELYNKSLLIERTGRFTS